MIQNGIAHIFLMITECIIIRMKTNSCTKRNSKSFTHSKSNFEPAVDPTLWGSPQIYPKFLLKIKKNVKNTLEIFGLRSNKVLMISESVKVGDPGTLTGKCVGAPASCQTRREDTTGRGRRKKKKKKP